MGVVSCGTTMLDQGVFQNIGAVTWDTTAKTSGFTAVSGNGYFCNTSSSAFTVTLPASPSAGAIVSVKDYADTFDTNNLTIARNGSNIGGEAVDATLSTEGLAITLVYVDGTQGWVVTNDGLQSQAPTETSIVATGGTITTSGDFKIHTFTSPGTFCVSSISSTPAENTVGYMVVAGGGGGGGGGVPDGSSGGGAGGFREGRNVPVDNFTASPQVANAPTNAITLTATGYPITVGAGGAGGSPASSPGVQGAKGSNSIFSTITSAGGGGGHGQNNNNTPTGQGGSGAGAAGGFCKSGMSGNTPPVSPPQGNVGGNSGPGTGGSSGGGGGACGGGAAGVNGQSGAGGAGIGTSITGSPVLRAGGGGGGGAPPRGTANGAGGPGGGGSASGGSGSVNTGGGGGGGAGIAGGSGGSGVVVIRYKYQ